MLLAFASTVIPDFLVYISVYVQPDIDNATGCCNIILVFIVLEVHDQDFSSSLDMYVFRNAACSSGSERTVLL
jgi:hypothetical protein